MKGAAQLCLRVNVSAAKQTIRVKTGAALMRTKSEFYKATQACSQKESFGTQVVFYALIFFRALSSVG